MKIVVFGAGGFVGSALARAFQASGREVLGLDMAAPPEADFPFHALDITSPEVRKHIGAGDLVLHLAAHQLAPSLKDPVTNARVNVMGTLNILEAAREAKASKVVFTSASSLVGEVLQNPVTEEHPAIPKTPYGITKLASEHYLRVYQELFGLDFLVFRFFNIYGPGQRPETGGLIPMIHRKLTKEGKFTVFGDGGAVRDYVYIDDLVRVFLEAEKRGMKNEVINLGSGKGHTILEVLELAGKALGMKPQVEFEPARPGEIKNFVADTAKLKRLVGYVPSTPLEEGIQKSFDWLRTLG